MKKALSVFIAILLIITIYAFPAQAAEKSVLSVSKNNESYSISDSLYGAFIEDISFACDGGLVSNLVNNNSFEYEFNNTTGWNSSGLSDFKTATDTPLNDSNPTYAVITADGKGSITNTGYTEMYDYKTYDRDEKKASTPDMGFKEGVGYDFSMYFCNVDFEGKISVYLDSKSNKNDIWQFDVKDKGKIWNCTNTVFTSKATEDGGLTIEFNGTGTIYIDFVSLVPQDSYGYNLDEWKYVSLRPDLFTALKQISPAFIRFPGGCLAEGENLDNLYNWKDTIGRLEERKQSYNLWKDDQGRDYINTMSMGYHEYFQLCRDLGAEALPIVNVGMSCQGRNNSADAALTPGTDEWSSYVQDVLDLIEYANGDSRTTYWGALRAANGSEEPFNIKYIGLGNENWGEIYERNFRALYDEVKKEYPDITVISSSGTYLEGEDYDYNWKWINKDFTDTIVDEHYYTYDGYLFDHNDRYDSFDRDGAHVFVGEYAATAKGIGTIQTKSNMYEAVEEASFLTGIERNGDVVEMASYAPTFAKVNAQCWNVNLIWFDSQEIVLTPSYYVQMLFANNYGTTYLKSNFANGKTVENGIYESVTLDEKTQTLYIKLVNTTGKKQSIDVNISDFGDINRVSAQTISSAYKSACNEIGKNTTYPAQYDLKANSSNAVSVEMDKYDVTVLRVAYGDNTGDSLYTLPEAMSNMPEPSNFLPPAVKIGIPCAAAGAIVIIAAAIAITAVVKKKKSKKTDK